MKAEYILNNILWVIKHQGWREVLPGSKMDAIDWDSALYQDVRDVDLCAKQNEIILQFAVDSYEDYIHANNFVPFPEYVTFADAQGAFDCIEEGKER